MRGKRKIQGKGLGGRKERKLTEVEGIALEPRGDGGQADRFDPIILREDCRELSPINVGLGSY
jgi:hypothetical protein